MNGNFAGLTEDEIVSILILLDYLFLYVVSKTYGPKAGCLNPYFIGLPILIS